jgi:hypothetical protein
MQTKETIDPTKIFIGGYNLIERLELTIGNIRVQEGMVMLDDMEKLEMLLEALKPK